MHFAKSNPLHLFNNFHFIRYWLLPLINIWNSKMCKIYEFSIQMLWKKWLKILLEIFFKYCSTLNQINFFFFNILIKLPLLNTLRLYNYKNSQSISYIWLFEFISHWICLIKNVKLKNVKILRTFRVNLLVYW